MTTDEREIAGITTRLVLGYVRDQAGPAALPRLLTLASETRTLDELSDERCWSSYAQAHAIFQAAEVITGDPQAARRIGEQLLRRRAGSKIVTLLRMLGSPAHVYRNIARTMPKFSTVGAMQAVSVRGGQAQLSYRTRPGYQRHREFCDYTMGLLTVVPELFGLAPAQITHDRCAARGAAQCDYVLSWGQHRRLPWRRDRGGGAVGADFSAISEQLADLQDTAADLVCAEDVETVLARIAGRAASAVRAQRFLLVVDAAAGGAPRVHADGFTPAEAASLALQILAGADPAAQPETRLVVDVASAHRHYGRLAAVYSSGDRFFPQERRLLEAYARYAATALDVATALDEARREGQTTRVLLDLARDLATTTSVAEVARRLARAVPSLVPCDHTSVILWNPETQLLVTAARHAVSGETKQTEDITIRLADTPALAEMLTDPKPLFLDADIEDPFLREAMRNAGVEVAVVVPIVRGGELFGVVSASGSANALGRLRHDKGVLERVAGFADQAAVALANAKLVEQIHFQAYHDDLTGLPNRLLFDEFIAVELSRSKRAGEQFGVVFLDLDRFKNINDSLGHSAGNELLKLVAERLSHILRESDAVARLGGDEFTVLLGGVKGPEAARITGEKIMEAVREPFVLAGRQVFITPSLGIAIYPQAGTDPATLLRNADAAMYRAKQAGGNACVLYAAGMSSDGEPRLVLEAALHEALDRGELSVHYQPQIDCRSGEVVGTEALLRWTHSQLGAIAPDQFIPIAEESGLITQLDLWILATACAQTQSWTKAGSPLRVAINVSARDLQDPQFADQVINTITASGLEPGRVELEITESLAIHESVTAQEGLAKLTAAGYWLVIDDFGVGYSALGRLRHLPVQAVKIDRGFIHEIQHADDDAPLVSAIIAMGHSLHLTVIAEGVERPEQLAWLRRHGCDRAQGYLLGRPAAATAIPPAARRVRGGAIGHLAWVDQPAG